MSLVYRNPQNSSRFPVCMDEIDIRSMFLQFPLMESWWQREEILFISNKPTNKASHTILLNKQYTILKKQLNKIPSEFRKYNLFHPHILNYRVSRLISQPIVILMIPPLQTRQISPDLLYTWERETTLRSHNRPCILPIPMFVPHHYTPTLHPLPVNRIQHTWKLFRFKRWTHIDTPKYRKKREKI